MIILIGAALVVGTVLVVWMSRISEVASRVLDGAAALAVFLFFVTAADAVAETLLHDTIFMTEVHRVLANPIFLASGAYLGPYLLARIAALPVYFKYRKG
ncbi:hypothetical protein [Paenibacillus sinopodophylli]|uniref:hypothetical protein n=1 Tax=Paenibacillus sinopodophylli TaxID=1837342 RepID=UPI00110CE005|nr:hypothetical protein [Paenibacillus sinopodophylli]